MLNFSFTFSQVFLYDLCDTLSRFIESEQVLCKNLEKKGNFDHMFEERGPIKDVLTRPQFSNKSKMMKFAIFIVAVFSFASAKLNLSGE